MALLGQNRGLWLTFYAFVALALAAGLYLGFLSAQSTPQAIVEKDVTPQNQAQVLEGTYVCLPRSDNKKTAECTPGVKVGEDYYALDLATLIGSGAQTNLSNGMEIIVAGEVIPVEDISSDQWDVYSVKGVMRVEEVARN